MKTVLVYSGGLDSTALLYHLRDLGHEVRCLGFDYGQRHLRELDAARDICAGAGVPFRVAHLSGLRDLLSGSALTDDAVPVPDGHYAAKSMKATVVPNRNMIFLAVAAGHALSEGCDAVAWGAHAGDHDLYPDCRPRFADAMELALLRCADRPVRLDRPFLRMTKAYIVAHGAALGAPLGRTWSCSRGGDLHCGTCGTCTERRGAFQLAGVEDPTTYLGP